MSGMRWTLAVAACLAAVAPSVVRAQPGTEPSAADLATARELFGRGGELARDAQWGAALDAFQRSARIRPHPWTTFNMAICERALGRYARARRTFARALHEHSAGGDLPESAAFDAERFVREIDTIIATLDVTLVAPDQVIVSVDGAPLEHAGVEASTFLVGARGSGPGLLIPGGRFRVLLDPGAHVFLLSREGFATAVHNETVRPGEHRAIHLAIDRLPAVIRVSASQPQAVVSVDGVDVGVAPVAVERGAGTHQVVVRKAGFLAYETTANVKPGQRLDLLAKLREEQPGLLSRWWFWTIAGGVVVGAAATTYFFTRPAPERPPLDGGGLGWIVRAP